MILIAGCTEKKKEDLRQKAIAEITEAEAKFSAMSGEKGIQAAFVAYCADSARIRSGDSLVSGKKAIADYYAQPFFEKVTLQWKADFVDASESGDMGYTFGRYTFSVVSANGTKTETKGIFHSVWKKQNGAWKFVWDS